MDAADARIGRKAEAATPVPSGVSESPQGGIASDGPVADPRWLSTMSSGNGSFATPRWRRPGTSASRY